MNNPKHIVSKLFTQGFGSKLRRNMSSGVVSMSINTLLLLISFRLYLHFLGYEQYGLWLILATVLSFAQLGDLGVGQAIIKLVAEEYANKNIKGIQKYVVTALALLCISGAVIFILILVFTNNIITLFKLSGENANMASSLLPYIAALSIYVFIVQIFNYTLAGLGRMDLTNYIQSSSRIITFTTAIILLYNNSGVKSLLIGNTVSYVFVNIASLVCIKSICRFRFFERGNLDIRHCKRTLTFGAGVFGGTLMGMFISPFNKLMLSRYAGISAIPVYEIAFSGSMQLRGLIEPAFKALMPEVSRLSANLTTQSIQRLDTIKHHVRKVLLTFAIPLYTGVFCIATPLFKIWLGDRFVDTIPPAFRFILIGTFLSLVAVPSYYYLMGMGHTRRIFISRSITALTNVILATLIILFTNSISVILIGVCLVAAWFLSSAYTIYYSVQTHANIRKHHIESETSSLEEIDG